MAGIWDGLEGRRLRVIDAGACGGLHPRWLRFAPVLDAHLFEPDPGAILAPANHLTWHHTALAECAGSRTLHLCAEPELSSFFLPNLPFLERFPWADGFRVVGRAQVDTERLDQLALGPVDFFKLDVQGAELLVLQGAGSLLDEVIGLEVEVSFCPIYAGQPFFADIDQLLRPRGFCLDYLRRCFWKRVGASHHAQDQGQLALADALYLRPPEALPNETGSLLRGLLVYLSYHRFDLAEAVLLRLDHPAKAVGAAFIATSQKRRGISSARLSRTFRRLASFFNPVQAFEQDPELPWS